MCQELDQIVIQKMSRADVDQVAGLEKICFSDPWSKDMFLDELRLKLAIPLVVKLKEKVVGYTCLWHLDDQMEVANFAVSPDHRRRGVGQTIIKRILWEAKQRGCKSIVLSVRESNKAAFNLYTKFGFVEAGRRKGYYRSPPEDALAMLKTL